MWPFKKRDTPGKIPMSPLSTSGESVDRFDPRIDLEKSFERFDPTATRAEDEGYSGD